MLARKPIAFCIVRTEDVFVGGAGLHHVWGCDTADQVELDRHMTGGLVAAPPRRRVAVSLRRRITA